MRIVSKFRDYYDGACAWDRESMPFYLRNTQEISLVEPGASASPEAREADQAARRAARPAYALLGSMPAPDRSDEYKVRRIVLAFCGQLYPLYCFSGQAYYDFGSLLKAVKAKIKSDYWGGYDHKRLAEAMVKPYRRRYSGQLRHQFVQEGWDAFVTEHPNRTISDESFRHFRSPVFGVGIEARVVVVNPSLKHYNFASQVDPYTAYQEIDMFLGNNLSGQMDPPVNVSDDLKRHYHGFDKQYGFRKRPKSD